jgi:glycosyltransferase involved in cell wall biosynthesis
MLRFRSRGESAGSSPVFDPAPLNIQDASFGKLAAEHGLILGRPGPTGPRSASHRVRDIYLNDPELQRTYPLGLVPFGQRHFLGWLTTHGRNDQRLTDDEIVGFLRDTDTDELHGLCLTYLLQPQWQRDFPAALTNAGWDELRGWLKATYGQYLRQPLPVEVPHLDFTRNQTVANKTSLAGVNILSHFCNPSGIQQAALWTKTALERSGLATSCRDIPVPRRITPNDRQQWLGLEIYPITILTHAAEPYFESGYERAGLFPRDDVYRIAYWAWELEAVPDAWVKAAELVEEIWTPTRFVAEAMRTRMPKPVYHMLPGVEVGPVETVSRSSLGVPEDHFVFLFMFDLHSQVHRKNPVAVFRAFQKAFRESDRVTLLLKTTGGDIHSADLAELRETLRGPNVVLLDQLMTRAQAYGVIALCDCFVSLHRSEGFGLGLAEAMLLAKPVIGTAYSGNMDYMTPENSLLVDYEMVEITEDRPIYTRGNRWAEPSIDQAAAHMRAVYEDPDLARVRAQRAQPEIQDLLSLDSAGRRMRARLDEIAARRSG